MGDNTKTFIKAHALNGNVFFLLLILSIGIIGFFSRCNIPKSVAGKETQHALNAAVIFYPDPSLQIVWLFHCMQIWWCMNCKVPKTEFCFTPCSVPERVSSTVHQTNNRCAHRWKHLFNPSPLGFPFTVCVHWTPMGSKCSLWDCTNGPCAEVRMLFVFTCMWVCVDPVWMNWPALCMTNQPQSSQLADKKRTDYLLTEHFISMRSLHVLIYYIWPAAVRDLFKVEAEMWSLVSKYFICNPHP